MKYTNGADFDGNLAYGKPRNHNSDERHLLSGLKHMSQPCNDSQNRNSQSKPKLLSLDGMTPRSSECTVRPQAVGQADEYPDKNNRDPACKSMVEFEEAAGPK